MPSWPAAAASKPHALITAFSACRMLSTQLARKRQKKRLYKSALLQETADLQATIVDRDGRIADLNGRIDQVQGRSVFA